MLIIKDRANWNSVVECCEQSDFYHTYDYHMLSKNEDEEPILIKYEYGKVLIAIPLLIRKIAGTDYNDATSVYGYCGPITNKNVNSGFDNKDFKQRLNVLLRENRIISVFSRLHPFILNQNLILNGIGKIVSNGDVVNIDITQSLESQRQQYNRRLKSYVNKAKTLYRIEKGKCDKTVDSFIEIYYENMKRVDAKPHYFFKREYFFDFLNSPQINADLMLAIDKETEEIAGGAIFTKTNGIVQYHLSGAKEEYLKINPIKFLIDFVRVQSTEESNQKYFNLGGGLGGSNNDSLFRFKSCFSKDFKDFSLWKYIVDEEEYWKLVNERIYDKELIKEEYGEPSFFPLYRLDAPKPPKAII